MSISLKRGLRRIRPLGYFGFSQIIVTLRGIVLLPIIAIGLSTRDFGIWSQISTTSRLLLPLLVLGLDNAATRLLPATHEKDFPRFFWSMFLTIVAANLAFASIVLLLPEITAEILFGEQAAALLVWLFAAVVVARILNHYLLSYLRVTGQIERMSVWRALKEVLLIAGIAAVVLVLRWGVEAALALWVADEVIVILAILPRLLRRYPFTLRYDWPRVRQALAYALPLALTALGQWLLNGADRYFVVQYWGLEQVAIYSAAYNLSVVSSVVVMTLNSTLLPRSSEMWDTGRRDRAQHFTSLAITWYFVLTLPLVIVVSLLARDILRLMIGTDLPQAQAIMALVSCAYLVSGLEQFFRNALMLQKRTRAVAMALGLSVAVNLLLNALLIPRFGIVGAGVSTVLSMSLKTLLALFLSLRGFTYTIAWKTVLRSLGAAAAMAAMIVIAATYLADQGLLVRLAGLGGLGTAVYFATLAALGVVKEGLYELTRAVQ